MRSDDGSFSGDTFGKAPNSLSLPRYSPHSAAAQGLSPSPLLFHFEATVSFFPHFLSPTPLASNCRFKTFYSPKEAEEGHFGVVRWEAMSLWDLRRVFLWFSSSLCGNNSVYRTCSITNITVIIYRLKLIKNAVGFTTYDMHISYVE